MRISDWSSDVCSSDLCTVCHANLHRLDGPADNSAATPGSDCLAPERDEGRVEAVDKVLIDRQTRARHGVLLLRFWIHCGRWSMIAARISSAFSAGRKSRVLYWIPSLNAPRALRSDERRVGNECVSTCMYRWSPDHKKKIKSKT